MEIALVLTLVTSLTQIAGYVIYDTQAFKKMTGPNVASWAIWAGITILNFSSYRSMSGDWMKSLLPTVSSLFCVITLFVAIAKGGRLLKLDAYDKSALGFGTAAALVWYSLKSATHANLIAQAAALIGFFPTWRNAHKEHPLPWFVWTVAFVLDIVLVVVRWTGHWQDLVYPIWCAIAHLAITLRARAAASAA